MIKFKLATGYDGISKMVMSESGDYVKAVHAEKMVNLLKDIRINHCHTAKLYNLIDDLLDEIKGGK